MSEDDGIPDYYDAQGRFDDRKFLGNTAFWPGPWCRLKSRENGAKRQWGRVHRDAPRSVVELSLDDDVLGVEHYASLDELLLDWIVD